MNASANRVRMATAIAVAVAGVAWAQGPDPALMRDLSGLPQAQGDLPPTPLSSRQEQQVMDAVFARFPNVDPPAMMAYIGQHYPDEMQAYALRSMANLSEAVALLMNLVRQALELQELEARRPAAFALTLKQQQLERAARAQAVAGRQATGAARDRQVAELRETVAAAFAARQAVMQDDLAEIEKQVAELRALVAERDAHREALVARRVDELLGVGQRAEW